MERTASPSAAPPLSPRLNLQLSLMFFLQYAIWGAWLPILYPFLAGYRGFTPQQIGDMFAVGAVGALLGPFIAGQVADRWFPTQRFLALSHLWGALLVWQLAGIETYGGFLVFSLLYSLIYTPTLALTNSLAFHHMPDRDRDFGRVRLWGTLGWVAVGIGVGQWLLYRHTPAGVDAAAVQLAQDAGRADAFRLSALLGLAMGVFCFFLPHTPPSRGERRSAVAEALGEIRKQPLLTLFLIAVPISCIHQFYFVHTAGFLSQHQARAAGLTESFNRVFGVGGGGLMTVGQVAEIGVLALMPLLAKRLSRKTLLGIGIAAYGLRMALFAYADSIGLLVLGVALHGLCFGCFIFVAFMIVDEETTGDVRASAQSLFNVVVFGIGIIVGSQVAGWVAEWATPPGGTLDYTRLFEVPMWASLACLLALLAFYPRGRGALAPAAAS